MYVQLVHHTMGSQKQKVYFWNKAIINYIQINTPNKERKDEREGSVVYNVRW